MAPQVTELEFRLLRDLIHDRSGIYLSDNKTYLIETRLAPLLRESRCASFGELYLKAKSSPESDRLCSLMIDAITTNETSWFRDQHPFEILKTRLLPDWEREIKEGKRRRINIWSAACSSGQEPYSIAMTILDFYRESNKDSACHGWIRILATDISTSSLAQARRGVYDSISIKRGLEQSHLDRYFHKSDNGWAVSNLVRNLVTFESCNLKAPLKRMDSFDVVFLRNVMIYFDDALKKQLFETVASLLAPKGCLFLGTGETVSGYSSKFHMVEWNKASCYQLR